MPSADPAAAQTANESSQIKQRLLAAHELAPSRRAWQRELEQVNSRLAALVRPMSEKLDEEIQSLELACQRDAVLGSREIAFCCYP